VGEGTQSKPLLFTRKCTNEVTDSSDEKPQDFINHTTAKQKDHFRTLAMPRNTRGGGGWAGGRMKIFFPVS